MVSYAYKQCIESARTSWKTISHYFMTKEARNISTQRLSFLNLKDICLQPILKTTLLQLFQIRIYANTTQTNHSFVGANLDCKVLFGRDIVTKKNALTGNWGVLSMICYYQDQLTVQILAYQVIKYNNYGDC